MVEISFFIDDALWMC